LLSISRAKVLDLVARGQLPCIRVGGSVRIPRDRLIDWIANNSLDPGTPVPARPKWADARADD
jgi:excisionase family DNA binding protein